MGHPVCPWWHAYFFDNRLRRILHKPEKIVGPFVAPGMTVMDIGCGMGFFSIGLAKLVGRHGCVISIDVQEKMLRILEKRAKRAGVSDRIRTHLCRPARLGIHHTVDFAVAFWMVHEVPDARAFFSEIHSYLKPCGKLLIAEPKFHVSSTRFQETLTSAVSSGFKFVDTPHIRASWSAVLRCEPCKEIESGPRLAV